MTPENHIDVLNKIVKITQKESEAPKQSLSEKYQEYKDWINEIPEISDEEIEKFADEELGTIRTDFDFGVIQGMKWYREQLKVSYSREQELNLEYEKENPQNDVNVGYGDRIYDNEPKNNREVLEDEVDEMERFLRQEYLKGYNEAKSNLFTLEQVREIANKVLFYYESNEPSSKDFIVDKIIQSIKQPK